MLPSNDPRHMTKLCEEESIGASREGDPCILDHAETYDYQNKNRYVVNNEWLVKAE